MSSSALRPELRPSHPHKRWQYSQRLMFVWLYFLCLVGLFWKSLRFWFTYQLSSIMEVCCYCQLISVTSGWWQIYSKEICDTEWEIERCQLYENLGTLIRPWWALNMEAPLNASALPLSQSKLFYWQNTKLTKRFSTMSQGFSFVYNLGSDGKCWTIFFYLSI